jgi:hypothetical protein
MSRYQSIAASASKAAEVKIEVSTRFEPVMPRATRSAGGKFRRFESISAKRFSLAAYARIY